MVAHSQVVPLLQQRFSSGQNEPLKKHFAAAMQSWRERCEKCVCLQGDYVEKCLHFQLPVVRSDHWKIAVARAERLENVRPRRVPFIAGKSQKSLGARSGEYGA